MSGAGWASEQEALNEAERFKQALLVALTRVRVGADFGERALKGGFFKPGLKWLEQQRGQRVLNDVHGIMAFETEPKPMFASIEASGVRGIPKERFEKVLLHALDHPQELTDRERISLDLFHASFFQRTEDVRFLLLMMAIEALLAPAQRSSAAIQHIEAIVDSTRKNCLISEAEKDSIIGSLQWLRLESINQTACKFVVERLGQRTYSNKSASAFFSVSYILRSRLVHGKSPFPSPQEVRNVVADLELFVSDLLAGPLLNAGI